MQVIPTKNMKKLTRRERGGLKRAGCRAPRENQRGGPGGAGRKEERDKIEPNQAEYKPLPVQALRAVATQEEGERYLSWRDLLFKRGVILYILPCKEGADPWRARIIKHKI